MEKELEKMLLDVPKEMSRSNRVKDKIIVLLIVAMLIEGIACMIFLNDDEYVTTEQTTEEVTLTTEGDSANAEYNNVEGNQYNDNAVHTEQ